MKKYISFKTKKNFTLNPRIMKRFKVKNPSIIFTSGPTGSGKSKSLNKTLELLYKSKKKPKFNSFLIDDYVENSSNYKENIKEILNKFNCETSSEECNLDNPSLRLLKEFEKAYLEVRNQGPCLPLSKKSCKDVYMNDIYKAIKKKKNILIETTGKKIPIEYLKVLLTLANFEEYNVIFVFSIVNFKKLIKRNKLRVKEKMDLFIKSKYKSSGPRLPNISPYKFKKKTKEIEKVLIKLRNTCLRIENPSKKKCGKINKEGNFNLIIFDNNQPLSKLIYDSRTNDRFMSNKQFKKLLSKYNLSKKYSKKKIKNTFKSKKK